MKNRMIKLTGLSLLSLAIAGCNVSSDFSQPVGDSPISSGNADFTTFVAIGDSLTAGYADGALYLEGQHNSYPAILAQQFAKVGGGNFNQPLVSDNHGGLLKDGTILEIDTDDPDQFSNRYVLNAEPKNPPTDLDPKGPERLDTTDYPPTTEVNNRLTGSFNNMGVPGAKSFHLGAPGLGNNAGVSAGLANPYYSRFASSDASSMIADATSQQPSFFIMWAGNNDILSYATSGGIGVDRVGNFNPASYGPNDITDPTVFAGVYTSLVAAFTAANPTAKGMLINIPDVGTIPYFTTVPHNPLTPDKLDENAILALMDISAYGGYNAGLQYAFSQGIIDADELAKRTITFTVGENNAVVIDASDEEGITLTDLTSNATLIDALGNGLPSTRQATADDLLVLSASSRIGTTAPSTKIWGISEPLEDGYVLIPSEIQAIETARVAFNASIKSVADGDANLIFFDAAAVLNELSTTGIAFGSGYVDSTYATGGAFSLDGVHPTARGYAVIANRMIDTINSELGAAIPPVDPSTYSTIFVK